MEILTHLSHLWKLVLNVENLGFIISMLRPNGGFALYGSDLENVVWDEGVVPVTKAEVEAGAKQFDAWQAEKNAAQTAAKATAQAKLAALGLTTDDLKALGL